MLARACNALRPPHDRLGAFIAYEIDMWIAALHVDGLRLFDLDPYARKYLGGKSMFSLVVHALVERAFL